MNATTPKDPLADALSAAHNTLAAFDALLIGQADKATLLNWISRLSGALILLTQAVEETPVLTGRNMPDAPTSTMWPAGDPTPFHGPSDGTEASR